MYFNTILRHICNRKILNLHRSNKVLPMETDVRVIVEEISSTSMLHKYYVSLFAHAVIERNEKEAVDQVLNARTAFAHEVSDEVMSRLRSEEVGVNPNDDSAYETDDSESDYEASDSEDLGSEVDSADI